MHGRSLRALLREAWRTLGRAPRGALPREIDAGWAERQEARRAATRRGVA